MPDVDSLLCKEISRSYGVNPVLLIEVVGHAGPDSKDKARQFLLDDKHMSESVAEKILLAYGVYWHRINREKRRKQILF